MFDHLKIHKKYLNIYCIQLLKQKQEWSSLESSSYEIEILFGHLVIANLQLVIGNKQLVIGRRQWKKTIGNWTDQSDCSVGQSGVSRQTRMSGQTRIS